MFSFLEIFNMLVAILLFYLKVHFFTGKDGVFRHYPSELIKLGMQPTATRGGVQLNSLLDHKFYLNVAIPDANLSTPKIDSVD